MALSPVSKRDFLFSIEQLSDAGYWPRTKLPPPSTRANPLTWQRRDLMRGLQVGRRRKSCHSVSWLLLACGIC